MTASVADVQFESLGIYIYIFFSRHSINCISNSMLHIADWGCCRVHARRPLDDFLPSPLDSHFSYRPCCLFSVRSFGSTHFLFLSSLASTRPLSSSCALPGATIPSVFRTLFFLTFLFLLCLCSLARQGKARQGKARSIKARHCQASQGNAG